MAGAGDKEVHTFPKSKSEHNSATGVGTCLLQCHRPVC